MALASESNVIETAAEYLCGIEQYLLVLWTHWLSANNLKAAARASQTFTAAHRKMSTIVVQDCFKFKDDKMEEHESYLGGDLSKIDNVKGKPC